MSGAHSQHRTPSRPTDEITGTGYVLKPGGVWKDGRCVEYTIVEVPVYRHVLDYSPAFHRPSKHARGRTRPRTRKEQRAFSNRTARLTQIRKTLTVDTNRLAAELNAA